MKKRALTLVEILVVISIVASLAAVVFPIVRRAKLAGHRATSISNLRQCGMALSIYMADYDLDWFAPPSYEEAKLALAKSPTCDPQDHWRSGCFDSYDVPMIGSYAYYPSLHEPMWWAGNYQIFQQRTIVMMSIFYAEERPRRFIGNIPPLDSSVDEYPKPMRVLRLKVDGSVEIAIPKSYGSVMTWDSLVF